MKTFGLFLLCHIRVNEFNISLFASLQTDIVIVMFLLNVIQ